MTVQQWLDQTCWTDRSMSWGHNFVHTNMTVEAWEISFLWFLWYVHSAGGVNSIWELDGGAQDMKFVGGSQQISEHMARQLDNVKLNSPVEEVKQSPEGVTVCTRDGHMYKAKYAIIATPPMLQNRIVYDPPLPARKRQLLQRMPMGSCIKTETLYKKDFWRNRGHNGDTNTTDSSVVVGNTIDDTRSDGSLPALTGFIMADKARAVAGMTKEQRKQEVLKSQQKFFCSDEALQPIAYEDYDWMEETYTGGCYTAVCAPGVLTTLGSELRRPFENIYFAGTETAVHWSGYMDGAVEAGERAAKEVLHAMGKIQESEIWPTLDGRDDILPSSSWLEANAPTVGGFVTGLGLISAALIGGAIYWKYSDRLPLQHISLPW